MDPGLEPGGDLEPARDLARARAILEAYSPTSAAQAELRERFLEFVDAHPDAHRRELAAGHLTAGCLLVDRVRGRVLLNRHRKLGRWLQVGGHCDGDANLRGVAWRETLEESGIEPTALSAHPVDLDLHVIPPFGGEGAHLHWDVRYLAEAPAGARERPSPESLELAWFSFEEARRLEVDASLRRLIDLAAPSRGAPTP